MLSGLRSRNSFQSLKIVRTVLLSQHGPLFLMSSFLHPLSSVFRQFSFQNKRWVLKAASCHSSVQTSRIVRQIVALDGGNRSSSVELTVFITNVHNQPPLWEQPEYWVTVPENTVRDAKIVVSDHWCRR